MFPLSKQEQKALLELARKAIEAELAGASLDLRSAFDSPPSEVLQQRLGAFVTLHCQDQLRGCLGFVQSSRPLYQTVADCAAAAAFRDPRFQPLTPPETEGLEIEISVLSPLFPIRPEEVRVGEHGLLVTLGFRRGLLLPQVAGEQGWTPEEFLQATCEKAGLPPDAWREGAQLEAFTALVFSEAMFSSGTTL